MVKRDTNAFRLRFERWKNGELVYDKGRPIIYSTGKDEDTPTPPALAVKAGDKVNTTQCAAWSNGWLRENGYLTHGNAWNLKNVDVLYNGYSNMKKPSKYDLKAILQYNHAAADSVYKNFDSSTLDKSKPYAVNMFYNGSPALEEAYRNGDHVTGTHTGALVFNPSKNRWYVTHNIHGTIHQEPFVQLLSGKGKYGVTAIYQPRENTFVNKVKGLFGFKDGKDAGETMKEIVVTPSTNDKKLVSRMKQMIPEYDSRIKIYKYLSGNKNEDNLGLSLNDQVGRLYDVYNRAKQPKIYNTGSFFVNKLGSLINKNNLNRANYNPITNAIHIPTYDKKHYSVFNLIPELSHAYQYYANDKNISTYNLRNIFSLPGDIKIGGKLGYDRPGNLEYSAHEIILPAIEDYLFGYRNNINIPYYVGQRSK